jgi:hypothetical protein
MKTSLVFTIGWAATVSLLGAAPVPQPNPPTELPAPQTIERGPHHCTTEYYSWHTNLNGKVEPKRHSYIILATGINYWKSAPDGTGQWEPAQAAFELVDGFAIAFNGQHKLRLAANLNQAGAIACWLPDNRLLRSHLIALAYRDNATGKAVLLAQVKDSIGRQIKPNVI